MAPKLLLLAVSMLAVLNVPCAFGSSATQVPNGVSPFAATGFLERGGEGAADLLIRAHSLDPKGMALVVAGYAKGIGGFPKDIDIAAAWLHQMQYLGMTDNVSALSLLIRAELPDHGGNAAALLIDCRLAEESPFFSSLVSAGLLESKAICERAAREQGSAPGNDEAETFRREILMNRGKEAAKAAALMRSLRKRPASAQEVDAVLDALDNFSMFGLLFFTATNHPIPDGKVDWSDEGLLSFLNSQHIALAEGQLDGKKENTKLFAYLLANMGTELAARQQDDARKTHDLIQRSLTKDTGAMIHLASRYRDGRGACPASDKLYRAWLQHAALEGDATGMLMLAVDYFKDGDAVMPWAWCRLVTEQKDAPPKVKRLAEEMAAMAQARFAEGDEEKAREYASRRLGEIQTRLGR